MRICFIGDSFVSGAYDDDCIGWVGRIAAAARKRGHDFTAYNLGIRGETSVQIGRRWRAEAEVRQSPQPEGRLVSHPASTMRAKWRESAKWKPRNPWRRRARCCTPPAGGN